MTHHSDRVNRFTLFLLAVGEIRDLVSASSFYNRNKLPIFANMQLNFAAGTLNISFIAAMSLLVLAVPEIGIRN
ncbi:hypothetical protein [Entomobacter blattae]|uniref:hypothetical protein n=1 Tax=Entomobacter blattae TaxID=2762277 RepID=UPI00193C4CA1|nr:hypothetical protein [Entomobacter blattae]